MRNSLHVSLLLLIAFYHSFFSPSHVRAGEPTTLRTSRENAVEQARKGDLKKALEGLRGLHKEYPDDPDIVYDYLVVSAWAGQYADVSSLARSLQPEHVPAYVSGQTAAVFRKTGQLTRAQHWYDAAVRRFPENPDIAIGRALTLADRGHAAQGLDVLRVFKRTYPQTDLRVLKNAQAYIRNRLEPPKPFMPHEFPVTAYRAEQDEAIAAARQGHLTKALTRLGELNRQYPDDQLLLGDYLTILQWSKENERVAALAGQLRLDLAPPYAVESVARALRELHGSYAACTFMETALVAQRRYPELLVSIARIVGESGDPYTAAVYLDEARRSKTPGLEARMEAVKKKHGLERIETMDALAEAERTLARDPGNREALGHKSRALSSAGGHKEAYKTGEGRLSAAEHAPALPLEHAQSIYRYAGLESAHWGEQSSIPLHQEERDRHLTASLASLDALAASPLCAASEQCLALTRMARIQPLYGLERHAEATAEYAYGKNKGWPLTPMAQMAAAGAHMAMREPRIAAEIYDSVIARRDESPPLLRPDDLFVAETSLFWARLEEERLSDALGQAQKVYDRAVRPTGGLPPFEDSDWKKSAAVATLGYAYLYTDDYNAAEQHFEALAHSSPAMLDAQKGLAATYSMRGLPRAALDTAERASIFSPGDIDLAAQTADLLMDMQEWRKAKEAIDALEPYRPYSHVVKQLLRRWETHSLFELRVDGDWAKPFAVKNPGTTDLSQTPSIEARLYSPPVAYDWRVYAGVALAEGNFAEGRAHQSLALGGVEYRGGKLTASLEVRNSYVNKNTLGVGLYGSVTPDDHWSFPFVFEKDSRETPLRARNANISADSAQLGISHRWNESRRLDVSAGGMLFSDDNQRLTLQGAFTQRLWARQTQHIDGTIGAYASANSKDDNRPYFNPRADLDLGGTITYGALLWRNYDNSFSHALSIGAGGYKQLYYNAGPVWHVDYSQSLDWTDRFSVTYGAGLARRIYDGRSEDSLSTFFSLVWKF